MAFRTAPGVDAIKATKKVKAKDVGNAGMTATYPYHLYVDSDGVTNAFLGVVDASSRKGQFGICQATVSSGATGSFITRGLVTLASGGTKDNLITAISAAGVITDASVASTNTDLALGVSLSASTAYLY